MSAVPPRTRVYLDGVLDAEDFPVEDVSEHLERPGTVVWVDLCDPSEAEMHQLMDELDLHELAVDDALAPHQRAKLDRYSSHLFLATHALWIDTAAGHLGSTEIDAFFNHRWIVTVRKNDDFPIEPVLDRWDRSPDLAAKGVGFLLYGLLDVIVDGYFEVVEAFDLYYEEVSEGIFAEQPLDPAQHRRWFDMRQAMVRFRRLALPMREVLSGLMRQEHTVLVEDLYPYFQDVYDHVLRITESSDSLRDLVATLVETNLSLRDYRQNLIVKKVGSWAAIVAIPTMVTGYFGMNVPYPGFASHAGVLWSSGLMVVACAGLYGLFRARDWL